MKRNRKYKHKWLLPIDPLFQRPEVLSGVPVVTSFALNENFSTTDVPVYSATGTNPQHHTKATLFRTETNRLVPVHERYYKNSTGNH